MITFNLAALQPKHVAAICVWEGMGDFQRDALYRGGILSTFLRNWDDMQVKTVQHGLGTHVYRGSMNGDCVSGPAQLTAEEFGANRFDPYQDVIERKLGDEHWNCRSPDWSKVKVPLLSAANRGFQGRHPRGTSRCLPAPLRSRNGSSATASSNGCITAPITAACCRSASSTTSLKGEDSGGLQEPKVRL